MTDFYEEILNYIELNSAKFARKTYKTYLAHASKLRQYAPNIRCSQIDETYLKGYTEYMRKCGNADGTVYRSLSILRMFIRILHRQGKIEKDPTQNFPLRRPRMRHKFLEVEELAKLYRNFLRNANNITSSEREAMRAFLFSCFTGLRYADLKNLCRQDMQGGKIRIYTHKTGAQVYIPVPKQAIALLKVGENSRKSVCIQRGHSPTAIANARAPLLHVIDNSTFNKRLRSGAKKLGCNRYLHTHLARHTFATSCITFGMPLEVVSKLLGHTTLQMTLVYASYSSAVIDSEMQKFVV